MDLPPVPVSSNPQLRRHWDWLNIRHPKAIPGFEARDEQQHIRSPGQQAGDWARSGTWYSSCEALPKSRVFAIVLSAVDENNDAHINMIFVIVCILFWLVFVYLYNIPWNQYCPNQSIAIKKKSSWKKQKFSSRYSSQDTDPAAIAVSLSLSALSPSLTLSSWHMDPWTSGTARSLQSLVWTTVWEKEPSRLSALVTRPVVNGQWCSWVRVPSRTTNKNVWFPTWKLGNRTRETPLLLQRALSSTLSPSGHGVGERGRRRGGNKKVEGRAGSEVTLNIVLL